MLGYMAGAMLLKLCSEAQTGGRSLQSRGLHSWLHLLPTWILLFSIILLALLLLAFLPRAKLTFDKQHGKEENINFPEAFQDSDPEEWNMQGPDGDLGMEYSTLQVVSQTLNTPSPPKWECPPFLQC